LTGSPGSGKTTVAPLVADHEPRSACLDLDWFFAKLRQGKIDPWLAEAHEQNRTVLRAASSAITTLAGGGYFTVAEGIIYPFMLDLFVDAAASSDVALHYAVLRAPVVVVQQRVRDRQVEPQHFDALADATVVDDLWAKFEAHGVAERHRIDSGELTPTEVAAKIYRRLEQGDLQLES
jgi:predicted kinase